jgi:hypothetical protein
MGPRSSLSSRLFTYEKKYNGTGIKDEQFLYSLNIPDPGSRVKKIPRFRIRIRIKEFNYFNQKFFCKDIGNMFNPDPDLDFLPNPDSGVKKARSATLILDPTLIRNRLKSFHLIKIRIIHSTELRYCSYLPA